MEPRKLGGSVPKEKQPPQFGKGGPQLTPSPAAAIIYTGAFQRATDQQLHQLLLNPYAYEYLEKALNTKESNEYFHVAPAGIKFSTGNAAALGGRNMMALQLTEKALTCEKFMGVLDEVSKADVAAYQNRVRENAKELRAENDGKKSLVELAPKGGGTAFNAEINSIITNNKG